MGALINKLNTADSIVDLARQGLIPPIMVIDRLVEIGFYDVVEEEPGFTGKWDGIKYHFHFTNRVSCDG